MTQPTHGLDPNALEAAIEALRDDETEPSYTARKEVAITAVSGYLAALQGQHAKPVLWVSSKQMPALVQGSYVAAKEKCEGNFDTPLYTIAALEPRASDRARTIEECAKVADGVRQRLEAGRNGKPLSQIDEHTAGTGDRIAAAIRKLSEVSHEH